MLFGDERYKDINSLINNILENKKHLIAVHRGSWAGNIIQNTIPAYRNAFNMGADLVECDINRTTDGVLYSFHDGYENFLFHINKSIKCMSSSEINSLHPYNSVGFQNKNGIDTLDSILNWLPSNKLLNIDRAWDIFPYLLEELDKHPNIIKNVIIKSPVNGSFHGVEVNDALSVLSKHNVKYMYMAICNDLDDVKKALSLKDINLVGCELIAKKEDNALYKKETIEYIHSKNLFTWVNAIELGNYKRDHLFGKLDDDISLENPDLGWGKLFEMNIDIIQTDWPALLYNYRKEKLNIE